MVLFAYGTLMVPEVMQRICGYAAPGQSAMLRDYRCRQLSGEVYPAIVPWLGERVEGVIYRGVTPAQLLRLDAFEGEMYQRQAVTVVADRVSTFAQTYVLVPAFSKLLSDTPWSLASFVPRGIQDFLADCPGLATVRQGDEGYGDR